MTGLIRDIADTRMFDINRCQQASARFHIFRDVDEWVIGLGDVIMLVGSGDGPRRTSLRGRILGKVEQELVPGHVVTGVVKFVLVPHVAPLEPSHTGVPFS